MDGSAGGFEAGFGSGPGAAGGQTREHAQLARSLGIEQLAVVVSKLDTCGFSQVRSLTIARLSFHIHIHRCPTSAWPTNLQCKRIQPSRMQADVAVRCEFCDHVKKQLAAAK